MIKFFPYIEVRLKLNCKTKEELEQVLESFIKTEQPRSTLIFANPDKPFDGEINKANNKFTFKKNKGRRNQGIEFITVSGNYAIEESGTYLNVLAKPTYFVMFAPIAFFLFSSIVNRNYWGVVLMNLILLFIILLLFTTVPFNTTGNEILNSLYKHLRPYILEETDLSPRYTRF